MPIATTSHNVSSVSSRTSLIRRLLAVTFAASTLLGALHAQTPAVGNVAPDFTLNTPTGNSVQLSKGLKQASTVLIVLRGYPGYQCPFCQKQLHDFIEHASEFAAKKATVLLVYPGPPADLDQRAKEALAQQANLPANITLVVDPDYTVTNLYGLRWNAPHETAYPATFILDHNGKVLFEKISHGHGDRTSAQDVLAALR
ncbi:peroxiredoxin family protein [Terriglobus roseus]|uniref:thioredoxin-dependent peroxiredoxin n=1 Tax=Terriglobus roseus TaxID=392734 RepID=A0A1H4PXJ0_9BACT|nr:peroxiredoxin family protein [Terriglobus roseus]SEC12041.1 Peroxiredoxin [Terriglobus roseus]